jgi:hypothetical protein
MRYRHQSKGTSMTQEALKPAQHWSDCAVHSEPAYPKGECDCGGIVAVADYTALSDKYVALSDKYVALKAQHKEQEPVAWLLTDKNINSLQVDSIQRLIDCLKHAHHTDLCVRINGQDEWFEADWLKHMIRVTPPQRTEQVCCQKYDTCLEPCTPRGEHLAQRKPLTDDLYNELLFAVENKYPDETRHQTALRYIKQAEMPSARPAQAAHGIKENT